MQKSLQKITNSLRIEELLSSIEQDGDMVEIWQPIDATNKLITNARVLRLNQQEIFFASQNSLDTFQHEIETYCYSPHKQIVFKAKISFLSLHKIALNRPEYLVFKEDRQIERVDISDKKYLADFYFGAKTPNIRRLFPHQAKLLNYTQAGIALQVNKLRADQFYIGDHITCKIPNKNQSIKELKVIHITPKNEDLFTIGLSFI